MLKRIKTADLRVGMYVDEFCGSWMDNPFWRSRMPVKSEAELQKIQDCGVQEVWIDTSKGDDCEASAESADDRHEVQVQAERMVESVTSELPGPRARPKVELHGEFDRASRLLRTSRAVVSQMFGEARMGRLASTDMARDLVGNITESVARNPNALVGLARLKTADDYTYMHSMATSALMVALARALGHGEAEIETAGLAGLFHDVGKAAIPNAVLNKPDSLTDEEWALMRSHPKRGFDMLEGTPGVSAAVRDAVLHHHEKIDGTGYPDGLPAEQISLLSRMTAICDVYDAVTSERAYKPGWEPSVAVRKMAEWRGHFDERIFQMFVRTVGIYPIGSLVRLRSQRLAVVVDHNPANLLLPVVKVFFSLRSKMHIEPTLLDLSKSGSDRIATLEDPSAHGFKHLPHLWLPANAAGKIPLHA